MNTPEQAPLCACGNKRERRGHHTRGVTFRPTCRACRYKGGKKQFHIDGYAGRKARQQMLLDQSDCSRCGFLPEYEAQLHLHHIDGDKQNNDPSNWEIVCSNCHVALHVEMLKIHQA